MLRQKRERARQYRELHCYRRGLGSIAVVIERLSALYGDANELMAGSEMPDSRARGVRCYMRKSVVIDVYALRERVCCLSECRAVTSHI